MTEREMLRLVLVNQAYILTALSMVGRSVTLPNSDTEKMKAHATITLDLVEKDEEENPHGTSDDD